MITQNNSFVQAGTVGASGGMRPHLDVQTRPAALSVAAACAIAAIALAVAMGIGRFAFTPLLPLMVRDGSLAPSAGAWLAASNYLGYLAGALTASRLGLSLPLVMRVSLGGTVAATAAMGVFDGLAVWASLRFLAGVMSAWTLVATSAWVLKQLAEARRAISLAWSTRASDLELRSPGCSVLWQRAQVLLPASSGSSWER